MRESYFHGISLLAVALGLLFQFSGISNLSPIKGLAGAINLVASPILKLKEIALRGTQENLYIYLSLKDARVENLRLKKEIESLLLAQKELEYCKNELSRILEKSGMPPFPKKVNFSLTRIVFYDPSGLDLFFVIEGGRDRKFKEGDVVTTREFVLGTIDAVYGSTSRVITPFNEKFTSPVYVKGRFKRYIYRGGYPRGNLLHVNVEDRVAKGDRVIFLDPSKKMPPFPLGSIAEVRRGRDPFFKKVWVSPYSDPRREDYVFVVRRRD